MWPARISVVLLGVCIDQWPVYSCRVCSQCIEVDTCSDNIAMMMHFNVLVWVFQCNFASYSDLFIHQQQLASHVVIMQCNIGSALLSVGVKLSLRKNTVLGYLCHFCCFHCYYLGSWPGLPPASPREQKEVRWSVRMGFIMWAVYWKLLKSGLCIVGKKLFSVKLLSNMGHYFKRNWLDLHCEP